MSIFLTFNESEAKYKFFLLTQLMGKFMTKYGDGCRKPCGDGGGKGGANGHSVGEVVNSIAHDNHPSDGAHVCRDVVRMTMVPMPVTVTVTMPVMMVVVGVSADTAFRELRSSITSLKMKEWYWRPGKTEGLAVAGNVALV